ncbi:MAG TPA: hypothetical protein VFX50_12855, partial [Gemmatimonadales bacterium]|nr:hypothetical protein [Gemmatimonadales bacterium]
AIGGSASLLLPAGERTEVLFTARVEDHGTVKRQASSGVNDLFGGDGEFPENAAVTEGTFGGLGATLVGGDRLRWTATADVLAGAGTTTGRVWGELRREFGAGAGALVRLKAGTTTDDPVPQMQFRAGGQQTVRAFDYGTQRGQAFWSAMVDVTPWGGTFRPVFFADAGWAGRLQDVTDDRPLIGAGVGLSIYSSLLRTGLIRFDLSRQMVPDDAGLRFDIIVQAFR